MAGNILAGVTALIGWGSYFFSPGETVLNNLDRKDRYPNNGYLNGY